MSEVTNEFQDYWKAFASTFLLLFKILYKEGYKEASYNIIFIKKSYYTVYIYNLMRYRIIRKILIYFTINLCSHINLLAYNDILYFSIIDKQK
jgi:hypothetical protein